MEGIEGSERCHRSHFKAIVSLNILYCTVFAAFYFVLREFSPCGPPSGQVTGLNPEMCAGVLRSAVDVAVGRCSWNRGRGFTRRGGVRRWAPLGVDFHPQRPRRSLFHLSSWGEDDARAKKAALKPHRVAEVEILQGLAACEARAVR